MAAGERRRDFFGQKEKLGMFQMNGDKGIRLTKKSQ